MAIIEGNETMHPLYFPATNRMGMSGPVRENLCSYEDKDGRATKSLEVTRIFYWDENYNLVPFKYGFDIHLDLPKPTLSVGRLRIPIPKRFLNGILQNHEKEFERAASGIEGFTRDDIYFRRKFCARYINETEKFSIYWISAEGTVRFGIQKIKPYSPTLEDTLEKLLLAMDLFTRISSYGIPSQDMEEIAKVAQESDLRVPQKRTDYVWRDLARKRSPSMVIIVRGNNAGHTIVDHPSTLLILPPSIPSDAPEIGTTSVKK